MNPLETFVAEIRASAGIWTIYAARFTPREPRGGVSSEINLPGTKRKPVPWGTLTRWCRMGDHWSFRWVAAHRRGRTRLVQEPGWRVLAWCYVITDDAEPDLPLFNLGVQAFSPRKAVRPAQSVSRRIRRVLCQELEPLGFREIRTRPPQPFFMVEKDVATRALAKRERDRLDRVIFADSGTKR